MFGQYSYDCQGRQTLADFRRYKFPDPAIKVSKPKTCTGHNRFVVEYPDGKREFWLHQTPVVTWEPTGTVTLRDGGWATMTTRRAMMEGIKELTGASVGIYGGSHTKHNHCYRYGSKEIGFNCPYKLP